MPTAHTETGTHKTKASRASSGRSAGKRDAIALLKSDHTEVAALLKKFEGAGERQQAELGDQICSALTVHATIEEEIFYPAARDALEGEKGEALLDEAAVEHDTLKYLIDQIHDADGQDELFRARITVLGEYVKHHVKEEETELFPMLKRTAMDLDAVGEQLEQRKNELASAGGSDDREDEDEDNEDDDEEEDDEADEADEEAGR